MLSKLASDPEVYQTRFSEHLSKGLPPEQLAEHFFSVKEKIVSSFKEEKVPEKKEVKVKPKVKRKKRTRRKAVVKSKSKPKRPVSKKRKKGEVKK